MVVENKGFHIDRFFIPPFRLQEGELLGICIYGGAHQHVLLSKLTAFFSGRLKTDALHFGQSLVYAAHIREPFLRSKFLPLTVGEYLRKNANTDSPFASKIYDLNLLPRVLKSTAWRLLSVNCWRFMQHYQNQKPLCLT